MSTTYFIQVIVDAVGLVLGTIAICNPRVMSEWAVVAVHGYQVDAIWSSVGRGTPFGSDSWVTQSLESSSAFYKAEAIRVEKNRQPQHVHTIWKNSLS